MRIHVTLSCHMNNDHFPAQGVGGDEHYPQSRQLSRRGFSLIELMVVVTVILTLSAMLFSAIKLVKEQAHQVRCVSNLRQMGVGFLVYAADNKSRIPPAQCPAPDRDTYNMLYWGMYFGFIESYLPPYNAGAPLYWCPRGSFTLNETRAMGWPAYAASYGLNEKLWNNPPWWKRSTFTVPQPDSSILLADKWGANRAGDPIANWSAGVGVPSDGFISGSRRPGFPSYIIRANHGNNSQDPAKGRVGVLCLSGRATALRWQDSYDQSNVGSPPNQWLALY